VAISVHASMSLAVLIAVQSETAPHPAWGSDAGLRAVARVCETRGMRENANGCGRIPEHSLSMCDYAATVTCLCTCRIN